jgi:hypothetical protein
MFLIAALGVHIATQLSAATFFSNLGQSYTGGTGLDNTNSRLANDFLTGASPTTIRTATLFMTNPDNMVHSYTLSIFTDTGSGRPGTLVGAFDTTSLGPGPAGNRSFSSLGISLAPNTAYWAVLQMDENIVNSDSYWSSSSSQFADAGSVFSTIPTTPQLYSLNGGANWNSAADGNFMFSLSSTVVPEPSTSTIAGAGVILLYLSRRKR